MNRLPQAPSAERGILGALMRDGSLVGQVQAAIRPDDMHRPEHGRLLQLMAGRAQEGRSIDFASLVDCITQSQTLDRYGGLQHLFGHEEACPSVLALPAWLREVREASDRRRIIDIGQQVVAAAASGQPVDELVCTLASVQAGMGVAAKPSQAFGDVYRAVLEDLAAEAEGKAEAATMSTGWTALDTLIGGFRPGEFTILAARPSMGKAQPMTALVQTPDGPVLMGHIKVGDEVLGADGQPKVVRGVYPQGRKQVYRVQFKDGAETRCCDEHLWEVRERRGGSKVLPLSELRANLRAGDRWRYAVPVAHPLALEARGDLPVPPYLLGALLGDGGLSSGGVRFTGSEPDVLERVRALLGDGEYLSGGPKDWRVSTRHHGRPNTQTALERLGLMGHRAEGKHIPERYLFGTMEQRLELLRGLVDTDGHITESGRLVEWGTVSPRMAEGFAQLVCSLGGRCSRATKFPTYVYKGERRTGQKFYRFYAVFPHDLFEPFASAKHRAKWKDSGRAYRMSIVGVEPDGEEECQCIEVEGGLYLTDACIVTHNTALAMNVALQQSDQGRRVVIFSLEMAARNLVRRCVATIGQVVGDRLMRPSLMDTDDWERALDAQEYADEVSIVLEETPHLTAQGIEAKAQAHAVKGLDLVIIDHLGEMEYGKADRHDLAVGEAAAVLKRMGARLGCHVLLLQQLNRGVEQRADKHPMKSDLRDSGRVEELADNILFVYRDHYYNPKTAPERELELIVAKCRMGRMGTAHLHWDGPLQLVTEETGLSALDGGPHAAK